MRVVRAGALALAFAISAPAIAAEPPGASSCSGGHAVSAQVDPPVPGLAEMVAKLSKKREDVYTWFDFLDLDDYCSFGGRA